MASFGKEHTMPLLRLIVSDKKVMKGSFSKSSSQQSMTYFTSSIFLPSVVAKHDGLWSRPRSGLRNSNVLFIKYFTSIFTFCQILSLMADDRISAKDMCFSPHIRFFSSPTNIYTVCRNTVDVISTTLLLLKTLG